MNVQLNWRPISGTVLLGAFLLIGATSLRAQEPAAELVRVTGTLVDSAGAGIPGTRLNICPEGKPGEPMLLLGDPVVLGDAEVTTDESGSFAFEFHVERPGWVRVGGERVATDVRLRLCVTKRTQPKYQWVGPWLDLKSVARGRAIALGKVRPE